MGQWKPVCLYMSRPMSHFPLSHGIAEGEKVGKFGGYDGFMCLPIPALEKIRGMFKPRILPGVYGTFGLS